MVTTIVVHQTQVGTSTGMTFPEGAAHRAGGREHVRRSLPPTSPGADGAGTGTWPGRGDDTVAKEYSPPRGASVTDRPPIGLIALTAALVAPVLCR